MSMAMFMAEAPPMVADGYGPRPDSPWRSIRWSDHLHWVRAGDGRRMNVVDVGEGDDAVVFVHGLGANWQSWLEQIPVLARTHRVLALDLPGFGHSEMPDGELTIRGMGRAVAAAMDARGIERAVVVGNSMGGFVGIELALVAPEKVDKLVLVSAAALWNEGLTARPTVLISRLSRPYATRVYAQWQWQLALRHPRLRLPALASAGIRHPSAIPLDLAYELMSGSGSPGFYDAVQALFDYKIRDRLPEIGCPTLVVWGTRDPLVPLWHAFEYEALIPEVRLTVMRDTGHVPQIERPERFNAELAHYLGEPGVGEPEGTVVEVA